MNAWVIQRSEYLALTLVLIATAIYMRDQLGWAYWVFLVAPDVFGLVPAMFFGKSPGRGYIPPRAVWLYNLWHTFTVPILLWVLLALLFTMVGSPWPLLGWLTHISLDRMLGFGLRGSDGGQGFV